MIRICRKQSTRTQLECGYLFMVIVLVIATFFLVRPTFHDVVAIVGEGNPIRTTFPISLSSPNTSMRVHFTLDVPLLHFGRYFIRPDDCLEEMRIDGIPVRNPSLPFCDFSHGLTLSLSDYLLPGKHSIEMLVRDTGGSIGLTIRPSYRDPLFVFLFTVLVVSSYGFIFFLTEAFSLTRRTQGLVFLLFSLGLLYVYYSLGTPYYIRSYDAEGHVEYVRYIAEYGSLPDPHAGWEFYQPFLYYVLMGGWAKLGIFLGRGMNSLLKDIQLFSALLTLLSAVSTAFIGAALFPSDNMKKNLFLFVLGVCVVPAFAMMSARITNDVFITLLSFFALAILLQWWKTRSLRAWLLFSSVVGIGFLTKSNILLFVPVAFLSLAFQREILWKTKIMYSIYFLSIIILLSGWFVIPRALQEHNPKNILVGNSSSLNTSLVLPNSPSSFLHFNPVSLLRTPFNDPWNDAARRGNFWEFFFRSIFFGESQFPHLAFLASLILLIAMTLVPAGIWGLITQHRARHRPVPLLVTFWIMLSGALAYRVLYPYVPCQDFRFSVILLVPWIYFVLYGIQALPKIVERRLHDLFVLEICLCVLLLLLLPFQ